MSGSTFPNSGPTRDWCDRALKVLKLAAPARLTLNELIDKVGPIEHMQPVSASSTLSVAYMRAPASSDWRHVYRSRVEGRMFEYWFDANGPRRDAVAPTRRKVAKAAARGTAKITHHPKSTAESGKESGSSSTKDLLKRLHKGVWEITVDIDGNLRLSDDLSVIEIQVLDIQQIK